MNFLKKLWYRFYWGCDCHYWGYRDCDECAPFTEEKLRYKLNQNAKEDK